ncbi:transporter suffix domain-containing protein [Francisella adeliensis]|uniref:Cytochrome C biogenesis protein cycl n=1 Tax=Francisella adeliensis TaxID=2007306 RepID=A0A2Z4Y002_9GAMM|nr:transporter suffix domain-containing protein [Francisella adeliensis]AXA34477.1 cytochrome C biogenesis protein cycl [Francisella adeliensis]MBK2086196.1 transporter suffix domain-containing protein [Francisella adeliensis]MBK2096413.1 transporter suffix domain-containing protein [Francisella adeliensis]QIW12724.1 transporter suffix domain-containing protein [Francisella adeliensis]QIW14600.1 transporter suffix domain-containing protein [Francisella adeliensis]
MDKNLKYYLGISLFVISFVPYIIVFAILPFVSLATATYLAVSSILLISAEVIFVISVMLLGKTIVTAIKDTIKKVFKNAFSQQKPISYKRYIIGMIMFFSSLVYPTISMELILLFDKARQVGEVNMMLILFSGDIIFIGSFFVLGSDFITKLKLAFKYDES